MHRVSYLFIICLFHLNGAAGTGTETGTETTLPTREISPEWLSKTLSFEETTTTTNAKGNTNTNHLRNSQRQRQRRQLPRVTGDVWRACSGNTTDSKQIVVAQNTQEYTDSIYEYTKYDDPHASAAACTCFYDKESNEYWAQCALNDQTCNNQGACTRTHEFFLFSDSITGDLTQKSSCQLCKDVNNCEGIVETCTLVAFDPIQATPVRCVLTSIQKDGSQTRCDDCTICRDDQTDDYGVFVNNCFGGRVSTPIDTCDTSGTAHLHNFQQPVPNNPGSSVATIGGTFGSICQNNNNNNNKNRIELSMYGSVKYSDEYFANCECLDPTQGTIACDLYVEEHRTEGRKCFANECTEMTELFYFDPISGTMNEKMTCDYTHRGNNNNHNNGNGNNLNGSGHTHDGTHNGNGNNHTHAGPLCSIVEFSTDTGEPIDCSMFSSTTLETCNDCSICRNDMIGEYGIRFNCFGSDVGEANCLSNKGRAVYNLEVGLQQSQTQPQQQTTTTSTTTSTTTTIVTTAEVDGFEKSKPSQSTTANNSDSDSDDTNNNSNNNFIGEKKKNWERRNKKNQSMVLGICLGGIALASALAVAATLCCSSGRHQKAAASEPPPRIAPKQVPVAFATELDDPPKALVDQTGTPMVKDPTPIVIT